jgi:carbonic anhydrase/acetyltransferase-like protein (isoleucine patch superfamily)
VALIVPFEGVVPDVRAAAYVAPNATIVGDVVLGEGSSVWFGAVLRGDVMPIRLGARSNIQDVSVVHTTTDHSTCVVGDDVTVGHRVVLHGCTIGDRVLVGMGSIVLDLAVVEADVMIGAGSVVTPRTRLPSGHLCLGSPARPVRPLRDAERAMIRLGWESYVDLARRYSAVAASP